MTLRRTGQALIAAGAVIVLFVAYQVFGTNRLNEVTQDELGTQLREEWDSGGDPLRGSGLTGGPAAQPLAQLPLGAGFAFIRIPSFGADFVRVVLEGTDADDLAGGPGHYVDTAMPGEIGNFALAGHRDGRGAPFLDLDQLDAGDPVIIETADTWFVYRVLGGADPQGIPGRQIVEPTAVQVLAPVPGQPDAAPTRAMLTLTTCHPRFSDRQRLIVHAELAEPGLAKADFPDGPPALRGG